MAIAAKRAADLMRKMSDEQRDAAIAAAGNVIDLRAPFAAAQRRHDLARAYRKPNGGGGIS